MYKYGLGWIILLKDKNKARGGDICHSGLLACEKCCFPSDSEDQAGGGLVVGDHSPLPRMQVLGLNKCRGGTTRSCHFPFRVWVE